MEGGAAREGGFLVNHYGEGEGDFTGFEFIGAGGELVDEEGCGGAELGGELLAELVNVHFEGAGEELTLIF